ncbi:MAG: tyrosine-type recombinase/integrase [Desulfovermiculus sp.]
MSNLIVATSSPAVFQSGQLKIKYLIPDELDRLTTTWRRWYDDAPTEHKRRVRGRYWLVYLTLRRTGARLGEVIQVRDDRDIDTRAAKIRLKTLKRDRPMDRLVPVVHELVSEIASFLMDFPRLRGQVLQVDPSNFRKRFYELADQAGLLQEEFSNGHRELFPHPHTLRHTRAVELLSAGIPVTAVQDLLGHSSLLTTAQYLRLSGQDIESLLRGKGL